MKHNKKVNDVFDEQKIIQFTDIIRHFYDFKLNDLDALEITPIQIKTLHYLIDHNGCNQQSLVNLREVKRSTVSIILSQMEVNGLIERVPSIEDKRMTIINLTDRGIVLGQFIKEAFRDFCLERLSSLSCEQIDFFIHCIDLFNQYPITQTNTEKS